jgi:hypothetical protein
VKNSSNLKATVRAKMQSTDSRETTTSLLVAVIKLLLLATFFFSFPNAIAESRPENTHLLRERGARQLAIEAFSNVTSAKITKYSIREIKETKHLWMYRIQGRGEFARPGNTWIVIVDKRTGKAEVESGE